MKKLSKAILDDFKSSSLDTKTIAAMQIKEVMPDEIFKIFKAAYASIGMPDIKHLPKVPACEIPYFNIDGSLSGYSRYKLFGEYTPAKSKKPAKYLQPPGSKPRFYFPPLVNWAAIAANTDQEIYIVEGEKKAAALTLIGFPAIGLGGVWSWKSKEDEISEPITDFNLINFINRKTHIVFDADV